jgi:hypothetical protein
MKLNEQEKIAVNKKKKKSLLEFDEVVNEMTGVANEITVFLMAELAT